MSTRQYQLSLCYIMIYLLFSSGIFAGDKNVFIHELIGQSVDDALKYFNVSYNCIVLWDEPPGKLSSITFETDMKGKKVEIELWIKYNPSLYSIERKWDTANIKTAIIKNIDIRQVVNDKCFREKSIPQKECSEQNHSLRIHRTRSGEGDHRRCAVSGEIRIR